jgi:hypothetical protein
VIIVVAHFLLFFFALDSLELDVQPNKMGHLYFRIGICLSL